MDFDFWIFGRPAPSIPSKCWVTGKASNRSARQSYNQYKVNTVDTVNVQSMYSQNTVKRYICGNIGWTHLLFFLAWPAKAENRIPPPTPADFFVAPPAEDVLREFRFGPSASL